MIRPAIAIVLLLSAILMLRGVAGDWHRTSLVNPATPAKQRTPEAVAAPPAKELIAPAPTNLPDLKTGYLFNQERLLASATAKPGDDKGAEEAQFEVKPGLGVSIDQITYAGSLIAQGFTRAVVVYPASKQAHAAPPHPVMGRPFGRPPSLPGSDSGEQHAQLGLGDLVDGYALTDILPDKLIFTKGKETMEKPLYDVGKKRLPPPPKPPTAGPPRPPGQLGPGIHPVIGTPAMPEAQSFSMPSASGGVSVSSPPPPATTSAPMPMPAPVNNPSPGITVNSGSGGAPAPAASPAGATASSQAGATGGQAGGQTPMTLPIRRMIISRQPAPGPDTSRVSRQEPGDGQAVPLAPTSIPATTGP